MKILNIVICVSVLFFVSCGNSERKPVKGKVEACMCKTEFKNDKHPPLLRIEDARPGRNEVVFLGDSLTYGAELRRNEAFPQLIDAFWKTKGIPLTAVNAGINGYTTERTVWRLDDVVQEKTIAVFLEIGANDWKDKRPMSEIKKDYEELITRIKGKGIKLFLAEIHVPNGRPGDPKYTDEFNAMYKDMAKKYKVPLMESFLASPVAENQLLPDNTHPNRCGHRLLARDVLAFLNSDWEFNL